MQDFSKNQDTPVCPRPTLNLFTAVQDKPPDPVGMVSLKGKLSFLSIILFKISHELQHKLEDYATIQSYMGLTCINPSILNAFCSLNAPSLFYCNT